MILLWVLGCATPAPEPAPHHDHADGIAHYTCPMHPDVMEQGQTPCPLCNMDLVPVKVSDLAEGTVVVDALRRQTWGIDTVEVKERNLRRLLHVPGVVRWAETHMRDVTAHDDVWVDAMPIGGPGGQVEQGDLVAVLRSKSGARREVRAPFDGVVIARHAAPGAFLELGDPLLRLAPYEPVWVEAELHAEDLPLAMEETHTKLRITRWPRFHDDRPIPPHTYVAKITDMLPGLDPATRRGWVRMEMNNPSDALMAGMTLDVEIKATIGSTMAVPRESVVHAGTRQIVFVERGPHQLVPTEIEVGQGDHEWLAVSSGLKAGDRVVRSGTFLVAAESRLRAASTFWAPR